jgi:hypothetical protein
MPQITREIADSWFQWEALRSKNALCDSFSSIIKLSYVRFISLSSYFAKCAYTYACIYIYVYTVVLRPGQVGVYEVGGGGGADGVRAKGQDAARPSDARRDEDLRGLETYMYMHRI